MSKQRPLALEGELDLDLCLDRHRILAPDPDPDRAIDSHTMDSGPLVTEGVKVGAGVEANTRDVP